jgi:hypothetical protein
MSGGGPGLYSRGSHRDSKGVPVRKVGVVAIILAALVFSAAAGGVATQRFTASPNDIVLVRGTKTLCTIVKRGSTKPFVTCYTAARNGGPKVGTYGVAITDTGIVVARYVGQQRTKTVFQRRHR